jgi:glycosyltransferase involved in cell wall biosynthesis
MTINTLGIPSISVILPAYNEEELIEHVLTKSAAYLDAVCPDYELIVINDGSKDKTPEILDKLHGINPKIKPIHQINKGYGGALQTGFKAANKDYVFFMDSDDQFDIKELEKLTSHLGPVQVVLGYREHRQDHAGRKFNAWGWKMLVNLLFGLGVRDIDCAFKIFSRENLLLALPESEGAMINTEMLVKLKRRNVKWVEVPVTHFPRLGGASTGANIGVILKAFQELLKLHHKLKNF